MSTALIPSEEYGQYADQSSGSYEKMKEIRLCVDLMKEARGAGIPVGNFFIFDANVAQGEAPVMTDIGNEFLAIVLRDAQRVEVYDKDRKQYLVASSEFRSNVDPVILYERLNDNVEEIVACLPYTNKVDPQMSIYHLKQTKYPNLRTKYTAYLLYEGEIYKFGFAATDNTGCEAKEFKPRGFADAADDSFMHVKSRAHSEAGMNVMFTHVLRIFSKPPFAKSVDFIKGFELSGRVGAERKEEIDEALEKLYDGLRIRFQKKTIKAWGNTIEKDKIVCFDQRHIPFLVQNPKIFTQQEKLPKLAPDVVIPEIVAPTTARVVQKSSQDEVDDVVDALGGDEDNGGFHSKSEQRRVTEQRKGLTPPDLSQKPRNRAEALSQKKAEREYIKDSGIGEDMAADAADVRMKKEHDAKVANDPGLAKFLADTEVEPDTKPASAGVEKDW